MGEAGGGEGGELGLVSKILKKMIFKKIKYNLRLKK